MVSRVISLILLVGFILTGVIAQEITIELKDGIALIKSAIVSPHPNAALFNNLNMKSAGIPAGIGLFQEHALIPDNKSTYRIQVGTTFQKLRSLYGGVLPVFPDTAIEGIVPALISSIDLNNNGSVVISYGGKSYQIRVNNKPVTAEEARAAYVQIKNNEVALVDGTEYRIKLTYNGRHIDEANFTEVMIDLFKTVPSKDLPFYFSLISGVESGFIHFVNHSRATEVFPGGRLSELLKVIDFIFISDQINDYLGISSEINNAQTWSLETRLNAEVKEGYINLIPSLVLNLYTDKLVHIKTIGGANSKFNSLLSSGHGFSGYHILSSLIGLFYLPLNDLIIKDGKVAKWDGAAYNARLNQIFKNQSIDNRLSNKTANFIVYPETLREIYDEFVILVNDYDKKSQNQKNK
jgi:hypothetical protein